MKITSAEFTISAVSEDQYPGDGLPEIVLIGKSNVGKSSLINKIINRKNLAKTSSVPGKTRTINFYKVNAAFYLVDLPGYGYAKAPKSEKRSWEEIINTYVEKSSNIKCFFVILDARRDVGDREKNIYHWLEGLENNNAEILTIITKSDKLSANKLSSQTAKIKKILGLNSAISFSAESGHGKEELTKKIASLISQ